MKKELIFFLISLFVLTIGNSVYSQQCEKKYKVVKIDSTEGNYLVYLQRHKKEFLLISSKKDIRITNKDKLGNKIKIDRKYRITLLDYKVKFANIPPEMDQSLSIDGKVVWKKGDIHQIYTTTDLAGLYYVKGVMDNKKDVN